MKWGGGGITRKSWHTPSAESLPSTACAQSSGEEGGKVQMKGIGEMKLRRLSARGREQNAVATALAGNYKVILVGVEDKYVKCAYL